MDELLEKLPYWSTLNDTEKRTVRDSAIVNHYESGNTLHGNCDKGVSCLGMIYVISGELRAYILSEEGREITLFCLREGDCCVLSASCIISQIDFDTMLTATEDSDVLIVPTAVFGRLTNENIHVRCFMYELLYRFCKEQGYALEISDMAFNSVIPGITSGKLDIGCNGIAITEERKGSVCFSEPVYAGGAVIVILAENSPEAVQTE